MDLPQQCMEFYAALDAGEAGGWLSPRCEAKTDGKGQRAEGMAKRLGGGRHKLIDIHVRRNVCFVQWQHAQDAGLDILAWNQDGRLTQWSRQTAKRE